MSFSPKHKTHLFHLHIYFSLTYGSVNYGSLTYLRFQLDFSLADYDFRQLFP